MERRVTDLFERTLLPRVSSARIFRARARLLRAQGRRAAALEAYVAAYRAGPAGSAGDAEMDVDDDEEPTSAKKRAKTNSGAVVAKRAPRANRQAAGLRDEEQARRANKLRNFDQRPRNYMAKAGEADRKIQTKMPKHLFAGKRKMGKTDRR